MNANYWPEFWREQTAGLASPNLQTQVMRTLNREPIATERWQATLEHLIHQLALTPACRVLDLCGGNGLIAEEIAGHCAHVVVVDVSDSLLRNIDTGNSKLTTRTADMREVQFDDESFDRIICYAALQYLSLAETVQLFAKLYRWLGDGGVLLIGDIPDAARQWKFFDSPQRQSNYFEQLAAGRPLIGTWFDKAWLERLSTHIGFRSVVLSDQPQEQIYSWFRFDMRCEK